MWKIYGLCQCSETSTYKIQTPGELPRRKHTTYRTWRKFEIKNTNILSLPYKDLWKRRRFLEYIFWTVNIYFFCRMSTSSLQLCFTLNFSPLFFPLSLWFHSVFSYHSSVFLPNTLQVLLRGDSLCIDYGLRGNLNNPKIDSMEIKQM